MVVVEVGGGNVDCETTDKRNDEILHSTLFIKS